MSQRLSLKTAPHLSTLRLPAFFFNTGPRRERFLTWPLLFFFFREKTALTRATGILALFSGPFILAPRILVLLFREDWRVGVALSAFALFALLVLTRLHSSTVPIGEARRQQEAEFFGFLGEQLAGTADVRANGATGLLYRFESGLNLCVGLKAFLKAA